jgi:hypothetical protein
MRNPLINVFDSGLGYYFEKVGQAIYSGTRDNVDFGKDMLGIIKKIHEKFQLELSAINELDSSLEYELREYFHAISKLYSYFNNKESNFIEFDARIYLHFIEKYNKRFIKIAKEIDDKYTEE